MADKNISTLPAVESIDNDSLFVAEQQGVASKVTGHLPRKQLTPMYKRLWTRRKKRKRPQRPQKRRRG